MADAGAVVGVDIGGTNVRVALVAPDGAILARIREPTPRRGTLADALRELIARLPASAPHAIVIGVPGRVDYRRGVMEWARHIPPGWNGSSERELSAALGLPVHLASDTDLAALGEARGGAGRGAQFVSYMTVSTGVGAACVVDGSVLRSRFSALELGETRILRDDDGGPDRFVRLEDTASGPALERHARRLGIVATPKELLALSRSGNALAEAVWTELRTMVGLAAANFAHIFVPDILVVGGSVGTSHPELIEAIERSLREVGPPQLDPPIPVAPAALGDDAGLAGAAWWPRQS